MTHPFFRTRELLSQGLSRSRIAALVSTGQLTHVAQGWYCSPLADPVLARALALGLRVSCLTGCAHHGLWVPPHRGCHVSVRDGDALPPTTDDWRVHRLSRAGWHSASPVLDLPTCIGQVLQHHGAEAGLMVVESAVNAGLLPLAEAQSLISAAPVHTQRTLQFFDPRAASGSETRVRLHMQRWRLPVRTQVQIVGVGRVDMLVGESWILETDSRAHHTGESAYESDRWRDLDAGALGFHTTRLTYEQVFGEWGRTRGALRSMVDQGWHQRRISADSVLWMPTLAQVSRAA